MWASPFYNLEDLMAVQFIIDTNVDSNPLGMQWCVYQIFNGKREEFKMLTNDGLKIIQSMIADITRCPLYINYTYDGGNSYVGDYLIPVVAKKILDGSLKIDNGIITL
jgi:hypothetical protein